MHEMAGCELSRGSFILFNGIKKMVKSTSRTLWIIVFVMFIMFFASAVALAHSTGVTDPKIEEITLSVRPIAVIDYSLGSGSEFDVNVTLNMTASNGTGLHGFALALAYDANLVECETPVREGDLLRNYGNTSWSSTSWNVTTVDGAGNVYASVNLTSSENVAEGNGTLIGLTFKVLERGETSLHIHNVNLYDNNGTLLSYVALDGYFNNMFLVDFAMPLTLLAVTLAAVFLNGKTEDKLKTTLEDKELGVRDTVLLVGLMVIMISSIVLFRGLVAPLMILFMFSYSMLLFIFTYLFSKHWYVAIMPPAMFVLLYVFLRNSFVWTDYLVSIYGVVFAVLITLYVGSLFSWKPTLIFAGLLTAADIILVLVTGTMVQAANTTFISLSLPVMVAVPVVPLVATSLGFLPIALGIGDFFFAGLLATQTLKKYGKTTTIVSMISMTASFFLFEMFLLTFWKIGFPGTLMIISGWLPPVAAKIIKDRYGKVRKE